MPRWFLGIEIGGTKLQLAVGRGAGEPFHAFWRGDIDASQRAARIHQQILTGVDEMLRQAGLSKSDIAGVGIGFGGPVDAKNGTVVTSNQVEGWSNFPLVAWIKDNLGWPAVLQNDADTAAFAEAHFGAGRGFDPVMYVTVGSGIGGGLICDGKVFRGNGAGALEIGHLRPGPRNRKLPGGTTVESIASGFGMEERARQVLAQSQTLLQSSANDPAAQRLIPLWKQVEGNLSRVTARLIGRMAAKGDPFCQEVLGDSAATLGWALAQAVTLINPARIVIGGGVSLLGEEQFFVPVRTACRAEVFPPFAGLAEIVPAALGEEVVIYGALALAAAHFSV